MAVGAQHVCALPAQEGELVRHLADAAEAAREGPRAGRVIAVTGGRGGAGASMFATALAQIASSSLLVDLDPWGGGIDLLLGSESVPGLRWPDLSLQGGRLAWSAVRDALPNHRGVSVLSGARHGHEMDAGAVEAVVDAGRRGGMLVICDLPRRMTSAVGEHARLRRPGGRDHHVRCPWRRGGLGVGPGAARGQPERRPGGARADAGRAAGRRGRRSRGAAAAGGDAPRTHACRTPRARRAAAAAAVPAGRGGPCGTRRSCRPVPRVRAA